MHLMLLACQCTSSTNNDILLCQHPSHPLVRLLFRDTIPEPKRFKSGIQKCQVSAEQFPTQKTSTGVVVKQKILAVQTVVSTVYKKLL